MKWERWLLVVALGAGAMLRLPQLDLRPMHTDEAVHALKFGDLLENGKYRYDKTEYHGPTLNYFTLLPAWLSAERTLAQVTEKTLRIVPVFFGLLLILFFFFITDTGPEPVAIGALLTACSPAMVFYSRYYIQETLLVCFAFGFIAAGYRLFISGRRTWAVLAGIFAGLMFATKETWLICSGAMALAFLGVLLIRRREGHPWPRPSVRNSVVALLVGGGVALLFFSSFFTHWPGVLDSVLAYKTYFGRAGENALHGHPWYYFLQSLTFSKGDRGPVWTEAAILILGFVGIWDVFRAKGIPFQPGRDLRLFLALYALLMFAVTSAIPYKTPWLMLGALQPMIIMAGYGASVLLKWLDLRHLRVPGILAVTAIAGHLAWQAYLGSFVYGDDPVNPYVYSHPTDDVRRVADAVMEAARSSPEGGGVQVISPGDDYWPLPWYLRTLKRVGWWNAITEEFVPAPVILASPEIEPLLLQTLYERPLPGRRDLYVPLFDRPMVLRPGKEIRGYVTLDLRNRIRKDTLE